MFYQDNNDFMRDSFYNGNGMNSTYPYNGMMYGNMQNPYMQNNYQMPMQNQANSLNNMYPQIYRIINPVLNRVVSTSNTQFMTEDNLNNMVDTIYNIVEGDVSSVMGMPANSAQGDDTVSSVSQNNTRAAQNTSNSNNERRGNSNTMDHQTNHNRLLRDLIKILLIKELLSRQNNNHNFKQQMPMNYYDPRNYFSTM